MNQDMSQAESQSSEKEKQARLMERLSVYALVRTAFSSERSLLSWMRTSASLYSFGFSVIKFMDFLERQQADLQLSDGPRRLGIVLICLGLLVLVFSVGETLRRLRKMRELGLPTYSRYPLPVLTAAALFTIGAVALIGILLNW